MSEIALVAYVGRTCQLAFSEAIAGVVVVAAETWDLEPLAKGFPSKC